MIPKQQIVYINGNEEYRLVDETEQDREAYGTHDEERDHIWWICLRGRFDGGIGKGVED
jgi:hypothetical protein